MDNLPRFTLRIKQDLLDKLDYIAKLEGQTKNKEIEQLIRQYIHDFEIKHGPIPRQ